MTLTQRLELRLRTWTAYKVVDVWLVLRNGTVGQGLFHGTLDPDVAAEIAEWFEANGVKISREDCNFECVDDAPLRDAEQTKQQKSLFGLSKTTDEPETNG